MKKHCNLYEKSIATVLAAMPFAMYLLYAFDKWQSTQRILLQASRPRAMASEIDNLFVLCQKGKQFFGCAYMGIVKRKERVIQQKWWLLLREDFIAQSQF